MALTSHELLALEGVSSCNAFRDFAAISVAASNTSLVTVRAADGSKTVQELIAKAKADPAS